jgi:hypothetical protein
MSLALGGSCDWQYENMKELLTVKCVLNTGNVRRILDSRGAADFLCEQVAFT